MTSEDLRELEISERIEQDIEGRKLEEERIMTGYKRKLCSRGCCFECDACNAKPGTPVLCADCLKRRYECYVKHNPIQPNDHEAESEVTAAQAQALADAARPIHESLDRCLELVDRIPDAARVGGLPATAYAVKGEERKSWGESAELLGPVGNRTTTYQPSGIDNLTFKQPQKRLVFDVETAALPDAAQYLEPVEPPSNYRDPAVIARYKADKQAEQLSRAALDPDLCRVVAIGAWDGVSVPWIETVNFRGHENLDREAILLHGFWSVVKGYHLVGYNCLAFDLPVLIRRSQYLGVAVPKLDLSKYKSQEHVTDLMQVLSFNGVQKYRSLNWYCKRWGITTGDDPILGSDVPASVAAGLWHLVEAHLAADLRKTAMLAGKLGLFAEVK